MGSVKSEHDAKGRQKIVCHICKNYYHRIDVHLKKVHKGVTVKGYMNRYPQAEMLSEYGKVKIGKAMKSKAKREGAKGKKVGTAQMIGKAELVPRELDSLSDVDVAYVPEHDENWVIDQNMLCFWEDLAHGIQANEPIYIGGPTGCGKTKGVAAIAAALNQPMSRVQLNRDFRVAEFVGQRTLTESPNGKTITGWTDGVLTEAMRNGWWLLLDEIDQAYSDVLMKLQAVLEGSPLVLTENFGEVVKPHEFFRIISTANTFGHGDETGLYSGAKIMNEAMLDRFGTTIKMTYPVEETEIKILVGIAGVSEDVSKKMVSCARIVREAQINEECSCTFSTRRLITWAKKSVSYDDVHRSASVSVLNKLGHEDRVFVSGIIQRHFKDGENDREEVFRF